MSHRKLERMIERLAVATRVQPRNTSRRRLGRSSNAAKTRAESRDAADLQGHPLPPLDSFRPGPKSERKIPRLVRQPGAACLPERQLCGAAKIVASEEA
jgi:hypothetical protein